MPIAWRDVDKFCLRILWMSLTNDNLALTHWKLLFWFCGKNQTKPNQSSNSSTYIKWRPMACKKSKNFKKRGGFVLDFKTHGRKKCCDSKFRSLSAFYLMKNLQGRYTFYSISLKSFLPSFYYCVTVLIKIFAFKTTYTLEVTQVGINISTSSTYKHCENSQLNSCNYKIVCAKIHRYIHRQTIFVPLTTTYFPGFDLISSFNRVLQI